MMMRSKLTFLLSLCILLFISQAAEGQDPITPQELLKLKSIRVVQLSPGGNEVIYSVSSPRGANDKPGGASREYFHASTTDWIPIPLFENKKRAGSPRYSPDGNYIGFLYANEGEASQVWVMQSSGGKAKKLTNEASGVSQFKWQPGKNGIAYLTRERTSEREKELKNRGYNFIFYEENLKNSTLHMAWFDEDWNQTSVWEMTHEGNTWDFEFNRQGTRIAASISPKNLIDQRYMFRKIFLINLSSGEMNQISENEGKLGNYAFSPDGRHLAYAAALDINDSQVSQAYVVNLTSGAVSNLTPPEFKGHISWVNWKDSESLLYYAGEGVYPTLNVVPVSGGKRKVILNAAKTGIIFGTPQFSSDFKHFVFSGSTPSDMANLYHWDGKGELKKVSHQNSWLRDKALGKQEVIKYMARDGKEIEGIMIHPVDYEAGLSYPLIVYVHGGPEAHETNGWKSRYSTPGQVMAGKGYLVLYLNYRASTGYGVDFAMEGFMDPAGKEFDDLADGIEWAAREKGADPERVGMAGGSYGGYASAWFATYYTQYVKAVCMFVGISNVASKRGTTDIPYEELYVHSGKKLEEQWQMNLERSPVYWAHKSKTATLIYGGASDTRVHPSQSLELYRRMKMNDHPAVRLVQYPGEGHGNRKQVGQIDVLNRQIEWLDWYVKDLHPLDGPMPRLDISDTYGLDWNF
ncbi:MAG: S9 family peptidase [Bacteroidota bacterium]|nr:S9 family peptidase [Bacteroidota bacterium]